MSLFKTTEKDLEKWFNKKDARKLVKALKNKDAKIRFRSVELIGKLHDPNTVTGLIKLLEDEDTVIIEYTAKVLISLLTYVNANDLAPALNSKNITSKIFTIEVLGKIQNNASFNLLLMELSNGYQRHQNEVCEKIVESLVKFGNNAVEPFIQLLESKQFFGDKYLIKILGMIGNAKAIPSLIKMLDNQYEDNRLFAHHAILSIGSNAVEPLIKCLNNGNTSVLKVLGQLGDKNAYESIIKYLNDKNSFISSNAIEAIGNLADHRALDILIELSNKAKREEYGKCEILEALGKIDDPKALAEVKGHFEYYYYHSLNYTVMYKGLSVIIETMIRHKDPESLEYLIRLFKNEKSEKRQIAEENFVKIKNISLDPLIKVLQDKDDNSVKRSIIKGLCKCKNPIAVEPLIEALKIDDHEIQTKTAEALGEIGDSRAIEPLVSIVAHYREETRIKAAEALNKLGESSWISLIKGNDNDFIELQKLNDGRLFAQFVTYKHHIINKISELVKGGYPRWDYRQEEGIKLFEVVKNNFSLFSKDWNSIKQMLASKHEDINKGSSNGAFHDCNHSDTRSHIDTGIGLIFKDN